MRFLCLATLLIASVAAGEETFLTANHAKQFATLAQQQYQTNAQAQSYGAAALVQSALQELYYWDTKDGKATRRGGPIFHVLQSEWDAMLAATEEPTWPNSANSITLKTNSAAIHMNLGNAALQNSDWDGAVQDFNSAKADWESARDKADVNTTFIAAKKVLFDAMIDAMTVRWMSL